jgi:hypothetical protein
LLEASREKKTMAEEAVPTMQISPPIAEFGESMVPLEAGGKTLTFSTIDGGTVEVDSDNEARVMKIITEKGFKIESLRKVGTQLLLDNEFIASATALSTFSARGNMAIRCCLEQ